MRIAKSTAMVVTALGCLMFASEASAVEFEPFQEVENVCPECEKPESDKVELEDGTTIRCTLVAANEDFFVVEKYNEVRGIPRDRVASTSYAESRPSDLEQQDQLVLKNGHVMTGRIVDESDKPGHFQLKSAVGDFSFVVFKSEVEAMYRNGTEKEVDQ